MNKRFSRFSSKDQMLFAKRLAFLVRAGVPILDSLRMLKKQSSSDVKARILDNVIRDVENGQRLSTSLEKFRKSFGDFAINIIKSGESGGILYQNLNYLADELRKRYALKRKIIGVLIYPAFIFMATLTITALLIFLIFPKVLPVFKSLNIKLPFTTQILIGVSDFLLQYGFLVILVIAGLIAAFWFAIKKTPALHFIIDRLILRTPLFGKMAKAYQMTNFCRTLGLLLRSNIRVVEAINIVANTTENRVYKKELVSLAHEISRGKKISARLEKSPKLFPEIVPQMVAVGETTGNLTETLLYLSEMYEAEVDELAKNLSSAFEPILMIFMGIVVGFIAISIITPIYEITQHIGPK